MYENVINLNMWKSVENYVPKLVVRHHNSKIYYKKSEGSSLCLSPSRLGSQMNTLLRSFQTMFFAPNLLTLYLMIDKALDSTLLKFEDEWERRSFFCEAAASITALCFCFMFEKNCSQTQLTRRNIKISN